MIDFDLGIGLFLVVLEMFLYLNGIVIVLVGNFYFLLFKAGFAGLLYMLFWIGLFAVLD